jgi:threonine synthase
MKSLIEGYRCLVCGAEHPWGKTLYRCRRCGSNLEVVFDTAALRRRLKPSAWRSRAPGAGRYRELLPVSGDAYCPLGVGGTPLLRSRALEKALGTGVVHLKDDTRLPSASFKDRASWVALLRARDEKAAVVAAASTGNAGASLACLSAHLGRPCVIFVPKTAPKAKLAQLRVFGARVVAVDGNYDAAFDLCAEASEAYGWFNRNTGLNPFTREGKKTVSFEIFEQLGGRAPDWVFVPTGDGNILSGVWKGFRELEELGWIQRQPRLAAVQARASNAISRTWSRWQELGGRPESFPRLKTVAVKATTRADSISVDLPRDAAGALRALADSGGLPVEVSDEEILEAQSLLARTAGVFAEPSAAASVAGARALRRSGELRTGQTAVCLVTGSGLKDVSAVLERLGEPPVVEPRLGALRAALKGLPSGRR